MVEGKRPYGVIACEIGSVVFLEFGKGFGYCFDRQSQIDLQT